jgi:hypothetical protein
MLLIDNNDLAVKDSFLELAKGFGIKVIGNYFDQIDVNVPLTNGRYKIPSGAPDANKISKVIHNSIIPEINKIIAELDSISDTASNRFRIFFTPAETGLENNLEVDYGEVLILKGLLLAFKSQLEAKSAYDVFVNVNGTLLHKLLYVNGINVNDFNDGDYLGLLRVININVNDPNQLGINKHFLNPYPNLLKVLPTANDSNNGTAILAQSKKDLTAAIDNYFKAVNYIAAETDNQNDDLVYIDPNDKFVFNTFNQKLTTLQNSLKNDTAATYPLETTKTYNVYDSQSKLIGQMVLVYDLTDLGGDANSLTFTKTGVPTPWEIELFSIVGGTDLHKNAEFEADLGRYSSGHGWEGYLEGTYNSNGNITNVTFEYWGYNNGTLKGLRCTLVSTKVTNITVNLNPIFGSKKYPKPVSPRNLLPQFGSNNQPLSGTFGHGLGNDATLGGILPGMTQKKWTDLLFGSLKVTISPAAANTAGAHWRRVGTTTWRDSGYTESGVVAGSCTVEFKSITGGWKAPANKSVTINENQTTSTSGAYIQVGSLKVTISPAGVVTAGAKWRRKGTSTWLNSGSTESGVPVGSCTVEFKAIAGWNKPANKAVTINKNQTTSTSGTYVKL